MHRRIRANLLRQALGSVICCIGLAACTPPAHAPAPPSPPPAPRPAAALDAPPPPPVFHPLSPPAGPAFTQKSIVLYQPDDILTARLGNARPLAAFIRRIDKALAKTLAAAPPVRGFSGAEVIAVKPGPSSHAWLVSRTRLPASLASQLDDAAESVTPVTVQGGPIAFAIVFDAFGGGGPPVVDAAHPIPIPREWRNGGAGDSGLATDGPLGK